VTDRRPPSTGPLSHLTVVDLTHHVAGPYCTKLLASYGARVLKVERPGGDPLRRIGPFVGGQPGPERSLPFLWLNAGKESLVLDLKAEAGQALLLDLAARADVLVENFAPEVMTRLGLGTATLWRVNPRLVITSISNFGDSGPYRDWKATEMELYALSGGMVATGDPGAPPLAAGPAVTQYTAGLHAYLGTLMALLRRARTGRGDRVEVSIHESALDNVEIALVEALHLGVVARRTGDRHAMVPWQCYPCRDGQVAIIGGPVRRWLGALDLFGTPELGAPRFRHMRDRIARREEFERLLTASLARRDKREVWQEGQARGVAFGYLADLGDALGSPQLRARGFFQPSAAHPEVGVHEHAGPPFRLGPWRPGRAPRLGEHTDAVLRELGHAPARVAAWRAEGVVA